MEGVADIIDRETGLPDLLKAARAALAALSQNKTYPIDMDAAKAFLKNGIGRTQAESVVK